MHKTGALGFVTLATRAAAVTLATMLLVGGCKGCSSRPHVGADRAGASVVLVDRPAVARGDGLPVIDEREPNDSQAQAQALEAPGTVKGELAAPSIAAAPPAASEPIEGALTARNSPHRPTCLTGGDEDWYRVSVGGQGRQALRAEVTGVPGRRVFLWMVRTPVVVEKIGVVSVAARSTEGKLGEPTALANLAVEAGNEYLVLVRDCLKKEAALAREAAPYRLTLTLAPIVAGDEVEPNDTPAEANLVEPGVDVTGSFERDGDRDWLRLAPDGGIAEGAIARIEFNSVEGVATRLRLYPHLPGGKRDAVDAEARGSSGQELRLRNAPITQGAFIELRADEGRNLVDRWSLHVGIEAPLPGFESEPNNSPAAATSLQLDASTVSSAPSGSIAGYLWPGDVDVFRYRAPSSGRLRFELAPPATVDARIDRLQPNGKLMTHMDQSGTEKVETLTFAVAAGEEVLIRASGRPHDTAFDAPYTLTWSLTADDVAVDASAR